MIKFDYDLKKVVKASQNDERGYGILGCHFSILASSKKEEINTKEATNTLIEI